MAKEKIQNIVKYLAKKDFMFGPNVRFLDFYVVELFDYV